MASIVSKNLYELLNDDSENPPEIAKAPSPKPTRAEVSSRTPAQDIRKSRPAPNDRRKDHHATFDHASRDKYADQPAGRGHEAAYEEKFRRRGRGRGGRGGHTGHAGKLDRHSRIGITEHEKQVAHAWGQNTGEAELRDEQAGDAMANAEQNRGFVADTGTDAPEFDMKGPEDQHDWGNGPKSEEAKPEPEEKSKTYGAYLAEKEERKRSLGAAVLEVRKANEGSAVKFPEGTEIVRGENAYIVGMEGKSKRVKERKEKSLLELDDARFREEPRPTFRGSGRGGRGGDRGDRRSDRGDFRAREGDRGETKDRMGGSYRGRNERGEGRGGGGDRGEFRGRRAGGRGRAGITGPDVHDKSAFPSLGA